MSGQTSSQSTSVSPKFADFSDGANKALEEGQPLAACLSIAGMGNPPEIFAQVTKDTPLIISHWQCSDEPAYRVIRINPNGSMYVGGSVRWSGGYGQNVDVRDLERYAQATFSATEGRK